MSFKSTKKIGRPGSPGKYRQPPGTTLFQFNLSGRHFGNLTAIATKNDDDSSTAIVVKNYDSSFKPYTAEKTQFSIGKFTYKHQSTDWSTPGSNPRLQLKYRDANTAFSANDLSLVEQVSESSNCTVDDLTKVTMPAFIGIHNDPDEIPPYLIFDCLFSDSPTISTTCVDYQEFNAKFLLPNEAIVEYREPNLAGNVSISIINRT